ncbi:unnamed protein product [Caenorhabditis bovis]|uniref:TIMELESS-interacting protein n=1 Tax=Caenorhabditis bovis TaxID=2654633 RepID=A0A8S1F8S1_9PELO|nr:unnamed protein product [Caenorhabditis bovis]
MDELEDFFGNEEFDREASPFGEEAEEVNEGPSDEKKLNDLFEKGIRKPKRIMNPRITFNENILSGPRGIQSLKETFKDFKPNPKGNPYENLKIMMKKYAHWGHLMFPKAKFEDLINRCETLGPKRQVKVYMAKSRLGMPLTDEDFLPKTSKRKGKNDEIIDDGADDEIPEEGPDRSAENSPIREIRKTSPIKENPPIDENEAYELFEEAAEKQLEEEQDKLAEMEDDILADFEMNNDW